MDIVCSTNLYFTPANTGAEEGMNKWNIRSKGDKVLKSKKKNRQGVIE